MLGRCLRECDASDDDEGDADQEATLASLPGSRPGACQHAGWGVHLGRELSPALDLCPSSGLGLTQEHTTTLNGKGTNMSRGDLAAFAATLALSPQLAQDGIDAARAAASEFAALAVSLGATRTRSREWAKAFKAIDAYLQHVMVRVSTAGIVAAKPNRGKPSAQ